MTIGLTFAPESFLTYTMAIADKQRANKYLKKRQIQGWFGEFIQVGMAIPEKPKQQLAKKSGTNKFVWQSIFCLFPSCTFKS
jgi:hypothetical protein